MVLQLIPNVSPDLAALPPLCLLADATLESGSPVLPGTLHAAAISTFALLLLSDRAGCQSLMCTCQKYSSPRHVFSVLRCLLSALYHSPLHLRPSYWCTELVVPAVDAVSRTSPPSELPAGQLALCKSHSCAANMPAVWCWEALLMLWSCMHQGD